MYDESKPRLEYPAGASDQWVNDVADKAIDRIKSLVSSGEYYDNYRNERVQFSDQDQELINSRDFLKRAVRGFVVEFLRQSRDAVSVGKLPYTPEARVEAYPGIFQATATVDWLVQNKMDQSDALSVLKMIIENTARVFPEAYEKIDTQNTPRTQIRRATDEVIDRVEQAELRRAQKAGAHTLVTR